METILDGKKIVYIPNEHMLEIERTYYEYEGLKTLISQFTSDSPFKPDQDRLDILTKQFLESYIEYNLIFNQIVRSYLTPEDQIKNITANFQLSAFMVD